MNAWDKWQQMTIPERMDKIPGLHVTAYGANWHELDKRDQELIQDTLKENA